MYENEIPAACTEDGIRDLVVYCSACGEEISRTSQTIPSPGHDWGEWAIVDEPTCTEEGLRQRACRTCGETESESIPANGHTPITEEGIAPTCTESGWTDHIYCAVCEELIEPYQEEIPALGHSWGAWETVENATCDVEGLMRRICQRAGCGAEEEQAIPPAGHSTVEVEKPTCTDAGYTGRTICTVCGQVVDSGTPAPALGGEHDFQPQGETFTNTYEKDGVTMIQQLQPMVCTICGYGETVVVDEWEEGAHVIEPGY